MATLPTTAKVDKRPVPVGDDAKYYVQASDYNAVLDALHGTGDAVTPKVTSTGSTTARLVSDRFAEVANVKDFGAKGDGVTDDTAAVQAAINALPTGSPGGGIVFLPGGNYRISGISVPAGKRGVRIIGASRIATYLTYTGSGDAVTVGNTVADTSDFTMSDLTLDLSAAGSGANGLHFMRLTNFDLQRVWVQGRSTAPDSGIGIYIDGTGNWAGDGSLTMVRVGGNFAKGIYCQGPTINTANHITFNGVSVSRTTAVPGTGTIGFHWGSNAGDGAVLAPDVESYDVGYQIDGRFLHGSVRSEANGVGLAYGATSVSNILTRQSMSDIIATTYAGGQAFNSNWDSIGFQVNMNSNLGTGFAMLREGTDNNMEFALRAGNTVDKQATLEFQNRLGANQWRLYKTSANAFVVDNPAGTQTALVLDGTNFDARGATTGAVKLNVNGGSGGVQIGNGAGAVMTTIGSNGKLTVPTGAAGVAGTATLVAGTVTVATTAVTASSVIVISRNTAGGTVGDLRLGAITAGTSFVINSASGTDTSTVNWWIVN